MARILIIPGLAVRSYAREPARALLRRGHSVSLLAAPAWRGTAADPAGYGQMLAEQLEERAEVADLVIGLSVGTQAAAAAAARTNRIRRLLLVSPTVDPVHRTLPKLMTRWLKGDSVKIDGAGGLQLHLGDWSKAGASRIVAGFLGALHTAPLEQVLPRVSAEVTLVHAAGDLLSTEGWVRSMAIDDHHFLSISNAPHSWPIDDSPRFVTVVEELLT